MGKEELLVFRGQVQQIAEMLYQNRAEGINELTARLSVIQQVGNICVEIDMNRQLQVLQILRRLIEGCQTLDVLALADTLYYDTIEMIDFCIAKGEVH